MRKAILWTCCLCWLALLIFLSSQPGPDTARTSIALAQFLLRILHLPLYRLEVLNVFLRLAAHLVCFTGLGGLLYAAMRMTFQNKGIIPFWAAGIVSAFGVLDEVKKVFISGRHLSWEEAALNVIGAWCGIIIAMAVMELVAAGTKSGVPDEIPKENSKAA